MTIKSFCEAKKDWMKSPSRQAFADIRSVHTDLTLTKKNRESYGVRKQTLHGVMGLFDPNVLDLERPANILLTGCCFTQYWED